ncbi:MAG: hypothetical protein AAFW65_07350 [Pseudomonadota bacterium]
MQGAAQAFVDAVYLNCIPSVLQRKGIGELPNTESTVFNKVPKGEDTLFFRNAGSEEVYAIAGGTVALESRSLDECNVASYGIPVAGVFEVVEASITQPSYGFSEPIEGGRGFDGVVRRIFQKDQDGRRISVVLSGNEPGAPGTRSRFSTVLAFVSANEIENAPEANKGKEKQDD